MSCLGHHVFIWAFLSHCYPAKRIFGGLWIWSPTAIAPANWLGYWHGWEMKERHSLTSSFVRRKSFWSFIWNNQILVSVLLLHSPSQKKGGIFCTCRNLSFFQWCVTLNLRSEYTWILKESDFDAYLDIWAKHSYSYQTFFLHTRTLLLKSKWRFTIIRTQWWEVSHSPGQHGDEESEIHLSRERIRNRRL